MLDGWTLARDSERAAQVIRAANQENETPEKRDPPEAGGPVSRRTGERQNLAVLIFPEN